MPKRRLLQEIRCAKCKRTFEVDVTTSKDPFQPIGQNWTCGKDDCAKVTRFRDIDTRFKAASDAALAAKPSKYHNEETIVDGIKFASKKEAKRYGELKLMEKAREIRKLEMQVPFELKVNGQLMCKYVADFCYSRPVNDGGLVRWLPVVEDAKGVRTPVFKLKKKLMKAVLGIEVQEV